MKRIIVSLCVLILGMINLESNNSYAAEIQTEQEIVGVEACEVSADILNFLQSIAKEVIIDILRDPSSMSITRFSYDNIKIMEPYTVYCIKNGEFIKSEVYLFPVISNGNVLFNIAIYYFEGQLHYSVNNELHSELTALINNGNVGRVYYDYSNDCEQVSTSIITQVDGVDLQPIKVLIDYSDEIYTSIVNRPELTISYPTNGFSINTDTYKRLDMSYCLVLQNNTLCAMPCIATIYRYRTKTFEMTAESLTRLNNQEGYGFNVTTTAGQVALINRIMPVVPECEYEEYWGVLTNYVVMHNINNAFPFIFGGSNGSGGHAFVLQGYQLKGNSMRWFYFNPWGDDNVTEYHTDGAVVSFYSKGYVWTEMQHSCLISPY